MSNMLGNMRIIIYAWVLIMINTVWYSDKLISENVRSFEHVQDELGETEVMRIIGSNSMSKIKCITDDFFDLSLSANLVFWGKERRQKEVMKTALQFTFTWGLEDKMGPRGHKRRP